MAKYDCLNDIIISKDASVTDVDATLIRRDAFPIDVTEVYYDKNNAEKYARGEVVSDIQNGKTAYVGQKLTIVDKDNGKANVYVIQNANGTLKRLAYDDEAVSCNFDKVSEVDVDESNYAIKYLKFIDTAVQNDGTPIYWYAFVKDGQFTLSNSYESAEINSIETKNTYAKNIEAKN